MKANFYSLYDIKVDAVVRGIPRIFPASRRLAVHPDVRKLHSTILMERL